MTRSSNLPLAMFGMSHCFHAFAPQTIGFADDEDDAADAGFDLEEGELDEDEDGEASEASEASEDGESSEEEEAPKPAASKKRVAGMQ